MLRWGTRSDEEGEERAGRCLLDEGDGDAKHDEKDEKKGAKKKRNGKKRRRGGSCGGGRRCRREEGDVDADVVGKSVRGEFGRARRRKRRRSR